MRTVPSRSATPECEDTHIAWDQYAIGSNERIQRQVTQIRWTVDDDNIEVTARIGDGSLQNVFAAHSGGELCIRLCEPFVCGGQA